MKNRSYKNLGYLVLGLAMLLGSTSTLYAVDGVIEINQARAEAGNVTPGDDPGFPVTISEYGSYRLTSNLVATDPNVNCIEIPHGAIVDLNGFYIQGPGMGASTGIGVFAPGSASRVLNGVVGHWGTGIVLGAHCRVENVTVVHNAGDGIRVEYWNCILKGNDVIVNGGNGIVAGNNSLVLENTVTGNVGTGLVLGPSTGYAHNVINQNGWTVSGGIQIGTNICGTNTTCP